MKIKGYVLFLLVIVLLEPSCDNVNHKLEYELKGEVKEVKVIQYEANCFNYDEPEEPAKLITLKFNRNGSLKSEKVDNKKLGFCTYRQYKYSHWNSNYTVKEYVNDSIIGNSFYYYSNKVDSVVLKDTYGCYIMKSIYNYRDDSDFELKKYDSNNDLISKEESFFDEQESSVTRTIKSLGISLQKTSYKDSNENVIKVIVESNMDDDQISEYRLLYTGNNWVRKFLLCEDTMLLFTERDIKYY